MTEIEFRPTLEHCIQTLAKQEYTRLMLTLLESGDEDSLAGEHLRMLKEFLENSDFNRIRSEYEPYLVEGKRVIFHLQAGADTTEYRWDVR